MKTKLLLIIISLILIPTVLAIQIDLSRSTYQPGELLQAEITGNFISLESENVLIYEQGKVHSTPVISDLTYESNIYYFYAILPNSEGDYSVRIEDAKYTVGGQTKDDTIIEEFTIQESNGSALSINPGFVIADEDFEIKVKSLTGNLDITAILEATGQEQTAFLVEDSEELLSFSVSGITEPTNISISLEINDEDEESGGFLEDLFGGGSDESEDGPSTSEYIIPVFVIDKIIKPSEEPIEKTELIFVPEALSGKVTLKYAFKIILKNSGTTEIRNIEITTDSEIVLEKTNIDLLIPNEQTEIDIIIPDDLEIGKEFPGVITASFDDEQVNIPFLFEITDDVKAIEIIPDTTPALSCTEKNGTICEDDEECSISTVSSTDPGSCCTATCEKEKKSKTGLVIGILIILIIVVTIVIFYIKGKRRLAPKSTDEILREKDEDFSDRMKGSPISGGLGRS
tara:strand:- start:2366 stop:3736 length:1371 start_codon:yes stop_codon:yes gene_type:complete